MDDDPESALVSELRSLARPARATGSHFTVVHDDITIAVSYTSGSSRSLSLEARYDQAARTLPPELDEAARGYRDAGGRALRATRPMMIVLRIETSADMAAKREGLSVEHQSGDHAFDSRVYVETPTADARVLGAVLNGEVRAAVLALMDLGFLQVRIDDGGKVIATLIEWVQPRAPLRGRGRAAVEAFARLVVNLPPVTRSGVPHAPVPLGGWTLALGATGALGWLLALSAGPLIVKGIEELSPPSPSPSGDAPPWSAAACLGAGLVAGAVASVLYGDAVKERARGRSDAHTRVGRARWAAFGGVSVVVFVAALLLVFAISLR